jgi:hypothetical protein
MRGWWGFIGVVAALLVVVLAAVIVPGFLRACCEGYESSAIGLMRAINSSQQAYASACAHGKFAAELKTLTVPPLQGGTGFIEKTIVGGVRNKYQYSMRAQGETSIADDTCNGSHLVTAGYFVEAHPADPTTGWRSFATDERGTVYEKADGTPIQPGMAGTQPIQ